MRTKPAVEEHDSVMYGRVRISRLQSVVYIMSYVFPENDCIWKGFFYTRRHSHILLLPNGSSELQRVFFPWMFFLTRRIISERHLNLFVNHANDCKDEENKFHVSHLFELF